MLFFSSAVLRVRVVKTARGCSPLERGVYMAEVNKPRLPKDDTKEINALGRGGMRLAHYAFNFECWEFRPGIGKDVGEDCVYEYIDDHIWHNRRIRAQVKGIRNPATYLVAKDTEFSYPLDKQFIEYALRSNEAFVLLLCDLLNEKVYYLALQDYFINNPEEYKRLRSDTAKMKLRVPVTNLVNNAHNDELVILASNSYVFRNGKVSKIIANG